MTGSDLLRIIQLGVLTLVAAGFLGTRPLPEDQGPLSPCSIEIDDSANILIIAERTGRRIDFLDIRNGKIIHSVQTDLPPTGICSDGRGKVYVTCSYSTGEIVEINLQDYSVNRVLKAGHGAVSPVLSPGGEYIYVANQFDHDISVIELASGETIKRIRVRRQPMVMDITPEGNILVVANFLPATRADIDTVTSEVSMIDLQTHRVTKHILLSNGSNALRGIKITPDGRFALVSHNLGRFQVPTTQLEQGWMNTSALSMIDIGNNSLYATILLDDPENGAAGAWGIDADKDRIAVAHSATHEISLIDYKELVTRLTNHEKREMLSYDLRFLQGIRNRLTVEGEGPRSIKFDAHGTLYAGLYFADKIQEIKTEGIIGTVSRSYEMNPGLKISKARRGEMYFHDARRCFQHWQACTGCHPNDARTDGLNWDLLNDGIGNPKNCKSMILSHKTPPAMVTGKRNNAEEAVRAGFRFIQFTSVGEDITEAVDAYLLSLKPVPSPYLEDGQLSPKATEGKKLFTDLGCAACHSGPYFTDGKTYEMGIEGKFDHQNRWDTPTLIEVWRTGPWMHDGRCAEMEDVFRTEMHGLDNVLGEKELECLVAFVMSI